MNTPPWYRWNGDTLTIDLYVQPRASKDHVAGLHGAALKVCLTAPPVDGKANAHLIRYVARLFRVKTAQVRLLRGETSRRKTVAIVSPGITPQSLVPGRQQEL